MATKSLGVLTLDLVAKVGGFVQGMDKAERSSVKWRKQVESDLKTIGSAMAGATALVAGATAVMVKSGIDNAAELGRLSQLAGETNREFQRQAAGARTVGIENEKLADIFKDVRDKVGDFLQTGAGPLQDFFENIGPKVGITADEFRDLSGSQVLGKYVDALDKAGLSQSEMTFYMEALASDATALLPLLRNDAKEMNALAEQAENLGLVLDDTTIKQAKEFKNNLDVLGGVVSSVGTQIAADLLPDLVQLTEELKDPETVKAAQSMARGITTAFGWIISGAKNTVGFLQWAAESAAAFMNGIAADDVVRLQQEIERLEEMKDSGFLDRTILFGRDGLIEYYDDAELDAELVKLRGALESALSNSQIKLPEMPELTNTGLGALGDLLDGPAGGADSPALEGIKHVIDVQAEAAKAAAKAAEAIQSELTALERAAITWGMSADEVKIYDLQMQGATDTQVEYAKSLLSLVDGLERAEEEQNQYLELVKELRTDEEKLTDTFYDRIAVLDAMAGAYRISSDEYQKMLERAADAAFSDAPTFSGLAPEIGGSFGELLKIDDAEKELAKWYESQLEMLEDYRSERADLTAQWDEQELALKQEHEDSLARIEQARQLASLSATESIFGDLSEMAKVYAGEQSSLYRAMFAVQKAAAIAQSLVSIQTGIAMAAANPFPANLAAMASVAAATASIVGNIGAIGMAHEGIDSIPQTGTWLLEKGERVTTAETSAKMDRVLEDIRSGQRAGTGGGQPISVSVDLSGMRDAREVRRAESSVRRGIAQGVAQAQRYR